MKTSRQTNSQSKMAKNKPTVISGSSPMFFSKITLNKTLSRIGEGHILKLSGLDSFNQQGPAKLDCAYCPVLCLLDIASPQHLLDGERGVISFPQLLISKYFRFPHFLKPFPDVTAQKQINCVSRPPLCFTVTTPLCSQCMLTVSI